MSATRLGAATIVLLAFLFVFVGCAVGPTGDSEGCPPADLVARYELVGSPRLCGGCDPDCHLTTDGPNDIDLGDTNADGIPDVASDPRVWAESTAYLPAPIDGIKIVPPGVRVTSNYAWAANTGVSTVTKVHLTNLTADGVYRVGLQSLGTGGNTPSRTTVDILGCAYVAQRAHGVSPAGQGSVTKIAGEWEDCPDLNSNSVVDSSTGLDDIYDWPGTVGQDECVLWNVPAGPSGGLPRALAIDALGRVWVGLYSTSPPSFVVLDSVDGSVVANIDVDIHPYGAAITPDGLIWFIYPSNPQSQIQAINTLTAFPSDADVQPVAPPSPERGYGIAVNQHGHIFISNLTSSGIQRYDPATSTWSMVQSGNGRSTGVVVDEFGWGFSGDIDTNVVSMYDARTNDPQALPPLAPLPAMSYVQLFDTGAAGGNRPKGVCPDFYGYYWSVNSSTIPGDPNGRGSVSVWDVGDPLSAADGGLVATIPVQSYNYTYSDFTGYGLMTFAALVGYVFRDYESLDACPGRSIRERLYWNATFDDPGIINFHARSSDTLADLPTAPEYWLGTADGSTAPGTINGSVPIRGPMPETAASRYYFRLRIELLRAGIESPIIHEWTLEEYCL